MKSRVREIRQHGSVGRGSRGPLPDGLITGDTAPSYYVEGLLYNVPTNQMGNSYQDSIVNTLNWLHAADRTKFVCANEIYLLLHDTSPVTWRRDKCDCFIKGAIDLWNNS